MTKRFFNMIPGTDSCCVLLYGYIGEYDDVRASDIVKELLEAAVTYKKIDVRINSMGGEVYTGIAIFNAIRNCPADITIYVDGIAASIASAVATCGKPVYASKYARIMIHCVTGGCYGNKSDLEQCAKEIEELETTLCSIYSTKTGQSVEQIRATYFDGQDHWLTASQALSLGFIDGVYDADPVPTNSTPEQLYNIFQNRLNVKQNSTNMIEQLKKRASFAGCMSDADFMQRIADLETAAAKVPVLEAEITTVKAQNKVFEDKAVAAAEAEITSIVDTAFKEGRITEPQKPTYTALLKADRENGEAALKALPVQKRMINVLDGAGAQDGDKWEVRKAEIRNKIKQ